MRTFVCLSGGLDSAVMLAAHIHLPQELHRPSSEITAVSFDYGSKHNPYERRAMVKICDHYKIEKRICVEIPYAVRKAWEGSGSSLMGRGPKIPEGHYQKETMTQTVVPCRNLLFVSLVVAMGPDEVLLGVHQGDHHIYPDCRAEFIAPLMEAVLKGSDGKTRLLTPLLPLNKKDIVTAGLSLGVPFELTRTCYKDQEEACGVCGSCVERREAFQLNNIADPIFYQNNGPLPKKGD